MNSKIKLTIRFIIAVAAGICTALFFFVILGMLTYWIMIQLSSTPYLELDTKYPIQTTMLELTSGALASFMGGLVCALMSEQPRKPAVVTAGIISGIIYLIKIPSRSDSTSTNFIHIAIFVGIFLLFQLGGLAGGRRSSQR
jgi:hypothetical protein